MRAVRTAMKAAGDEGRVVEGRGVARPARDQLPLRRRAQDRRRPRRLQDGAEDARAPVRDVGHVHGEARPHVGRVVVPHPLVPLARQRVRVRRRERRLQALPRRSDRVRVGARDLLRADDQLVQALRRRQLGADDARLGATTTARAATASSVTARRCVPRRASPAPTRIRTSRSRRCSPRACTGSRRSSSSGPRSRGTRTSPTSSASRTRCATRSTRLERGTLARRLLGDEVVDHYLNYARTEQRLFDEVGDVLRAGADVRAWLEPARRHHDLRRGRGVGSLAARGRAHPLRLRARDRARRRARVARAAGRRRGGGDARRARRARCSRAATTSTRRATAPRRTRRRAARSPSATAASWRCSKARSRATCRCSPSAAASRC